MVAGNEKSYPIGTSSDRSRAPSVKRTEKVMTAPAEVRPDPRVTVPVVALDEQLRFVLAVRDDITRLSRLVGKLRSVKTQLTARNELLKDNPKAGEVVKAGKGLVDSLTAMEERLHNPKAEITYDILAQKGGARLYSRYGPLYSWAIDAESSTTSSTSTLPGSGMQYPERISCDHVTSVPTTA